MPRVNVVVETDISRSPRARQLEGMFDVPPAQKARLEWDLEMPIEADDWHVGLIVGPSGCGKTTIARHVFGDLVDRKLTWAGKSVIDDFDKKHSMERIADVCQAVGFNTIPAWLRPFHVLSNGEQFRVTMARNLLEGGDLIVMDEFTSVVDRQVAQIGSHAVQKFIRKSATKKFVAVTCHYDIVDWLQPDWVLDPAHGRFERRSLRRRPELEVTISPVDYAAWQVFAPFHYLTAELNKAARCFGLFVGDRIAAFAAMLWRPNHVGSEPIMGCSRLVTLPDYQGLGLAFVLIETVAAWYRAFDVQVHTYPAHPSLIRAFDRSVNWSLRKRPGKFSPPPGTTSCMANSDKHGRPCAVFRFEGPAGAADDAREVLAFWPGHFDMLQRNGQKSCK